MTRIANQDRRPEGRDTAPDAAPRVDRGWVNLGAEQWVRARDGMTLLGCGGASGVARGVMLGSLFDARSIPVHCSVDALRDALIAAERHAPLWVDLTTLDYPIRVRVEKADY